MPTDKPRVTISLTTEEYKKLSDLAKKDRRSISATIAKLAMERFEALEASED